MRIAGSNSRQAIKAETDIFGRDQFAAGMLNLFQTSDDPLVVALDEKWGTGKTVFAKRLEKKAPDKDFTVVYFDAFKRDYDPDVFIALSAELLAKLPASENKTSIRNNAKVVGKTILKVGLKAAVRLGTAGAVRVGDLSDAVEEAANEIGDIAEAELDALIDRRLDSARLADETFDKFKISLEKLTKTSQKEDDGAKPLLFIVDELDRCRPDYALSVLETIKHFFSVPNVHFLLVCDIEQLVAAIHHRYGIEGHGYTYLEKFIDVRVSFPTMRKHERERAITTFVKSFTQDMPPDGEGGKLWRSMIEFITDLSLSKEYSIRRVEKILTQFAVAMRFTKTEQLRIPSIIFVLCDLKLSNPRLFAKSKNGKLSYSELTDHYKFDEEKYGRLMNWLRYFYDDTIDRKSAEWERMGQSLWRYNFHDVEDISNYLANEVVDKIG